MVESPPVKPATILDPTKPQEVSYAIPLWLRDQQILSAIARPGVGRIQARPNDAPARTEPIAIVGFGPSLRDTWEKIKDFSYVITCSGSHKFLLERGIVPIAGQFWHAEVDPRAHKVKLIGPPHPDVEYLIASTCHPKVFDHLSGFKVLLWHVFDSKEEGIRMLPPGEWALTGGSDVGLRAITLARFMGFTNLHMFGFDGCEGVIGKHADEHPNEAVGHVLCEYEGVTYKTTFAMCECARQISHELNQLPDVKATFYGEGLIQHMMRNHKPNPIPLEKVRLGYAKPELISDEYRDLNARLHKDNLAYGVAGDRHAPVVIKLAEHIKAKSVLDYGAGKGSLARALPFPIWEFDPAIEGKQSSPRPADLVVCTDVLEHIEPDRLMFVLGDLKRCVRKIGYFVIHTGPSTKTLADGRNSHLIQKPRAWWEEMLKNFFSLADNSIIERPPMLYIVVGKQP